jgi:hypothetical protein
MRWLVLIVCITVYNISCSCINYEDVTIGEEPVVQTCDMQETNVWFPGDVSKGRISGIKNCRPFLASAKAEIGTPGGVSGLALDIRTYEQSWPALDPKEEIFVGALSIQKGTYPMHNENTGEQFGYYFLWYDYDSIEAHYELDSLYDNQITFLSFKDSPRTVEGYFNCQFILIEQESWANNPDTIRFEDCHFKVDIIE